jgi:cellulose synthase/poly-beta-1,6-N-acetylglucosamine synthase-like glycosyltransferase
MMFLISVVLSIVAIFLSFFALIYCVESVAAVLASLKAPMRADPGNRRSALAVVIPANESGTIGAIVAMVREQLHAGDRLIVIADNCSDDTASIARNAGAVVVERMHETRRGKGYALDHGVRYLEGDPPSIVVFIDADSKIETDTLNVLARTCELVDRPVQAKYVMVPPPHSRLDFHVASFGLVVKNHVRLLGLKQFGLPCQLTGTGMAFPWEVIRNADLAHGHITEDMKLGLDLAAAGHPPYFCPEATVSSDFPYTAKGASTQRERWEKGHLSMVFLAPKFLLTALRKRDANLLFLTLDMAVPPMFLLILLLTLTALVAAAVAALGGLALPVWIASAALALVVAATLASWWVFGREMLPARLLPRIIPFVAAKLRLYPRALLRRSEPQWIRTDRARPDDENGPRSRP